MIIIKYIVILSFIHLYVIYFSIFFFLFIFIFFFFLFHSIFSLISFFFRSFVHSFLSFSFPHSIHVNTLVLFCKWVSTILWFCSVSWWYFVFWSLISWDFSAKGYTRPPLVLTPPQSSVPSRVCVCVCVVCVYACVVCVYACIVCVCVCVKPAVEGGVCLSAAVCPAEGVRGVCKGFCQDQWAGCEGFV